MDKNKKAASWDKLGVQDGKFDAFRQIVATLRSKDGCPWDKEQTLESLKPCLIDEAAEVLAGIDLYQESGSAANLCEELGDLLLQVVLLTQVAQDMGLFSMEDVIRGISTKMIRRHPHVFGEEASLSCMPPGTDEDIFRREPVLHAADPDEDTKEAWALWDAVKRAEKQVYTPAELQMQKQKVEEASLWAAGHLAGKE